MDEETRDRAPDSGRSEPSRSDVERGLDARLSVFIQGTDGQPVKAPRGPLERLGRVPVLVVAIAVAAWMIRTDPWFALGLAVGIGGGRLVIVLLPDDFLYRLSRPVKWLVAVGLFLAGGMAQGGPALDRGFADGFFLTLLDGLWREQTGKPSTPR